MPEFEVFVSYSRHDEPIVVPIIKLLRLGGHGMVFLDLDSIEPGELWRGKLEEALRTATYVVLFWCRHSSDSREVEREYRAALATGKRLVPVLLDKTPLPPGLDQYQWIDLAALADATHSKMAPPRALTTAVPAGRSREDDDLPRPEFLGGARRPILTLLARNGLPLAQPVEVSFDERGGTIGRSNSNSLVLPDIERRISRVQAAVVFGGGRYGVVNRGASAIALNGRALGTGEQAPIAAGDVLHIGDYVIGVRWEAARAAAEGDSFADLLAPVPAPAETPLPSVTPSPPQRPSAPAGQSGSRLPDDFDPFAMPLPGPLAPASPDPASLPQETSIGSIDELFGLGGSADPMCDFSSAPLDSQREMAEMIRLQLLRQASHDGLS